MVIYDTQTGREALDWTTTSWSNKTVPVGEAVDGALRRLFAALNEIKSPIRSPLDLNPELSSQYQEKPTFLIPSDLIDLDNLAAEAAGPFSVVSKGTNETFACIPDGEAVGFTIRENRPLVLKSPAP